MRVSVQTQTRSLISNANLPLRPEPAGIALSTMESNHHTLYQLYPNPTEAVFTLDLGRLSLNVTVELHDLSGKLLKEQHYTALQQTTWQLEHNWPQGVYIVSVQIANQPPIYRKVIKQ